MKKYEVLLKKDNGTENVEIIEALNENDARWAGKKMDNVYEAVVLRRTDKRKYNGGARSGSGREPIDPEEKKVAIPFYIKKKHVATAKEQIQPIVDKINMPGNTIRFSKDKIENWLGTREVKNRKTYAELK